MINFFRRKKNKLTKKECMGRILRISILLGGIPITQVSYILEEAERLICDCHMTGLYTPRYIAKLEKKNKLSKEDYMGRIVQISILLGGISFSQVRYILEEVGRLICDCHVTDLRNPQYVAKLEEIQEKYWDKDPHYRFHPRGSTES